VGFLRASEDPIRALNNHAKRFALIGHNPTEINAWEKYCEIIADHLSKAGWSWGRLSEQDARTDTGACESQVASRNANLQP
jgi:hypothetical protein